MSQCNKTNTAEHAYNEMGPWKQKVLNNSSSNIDTVFCVDQYHRVKEEGSRAFSCGCISAQKIQ